MCQSPTHRLFALLSVDISGCKQITDEGLASIIEVSPLLECLSVSGEFTNSIVTLLAKSCVALSEVYFKDCPRLTNQALISLSSLALLTLHLEGNSYFSTSGLGSIASNTNLQVLRVLNCPKIISIPQFPFLRDLITDPPIPSTK